MKAVVYIREPHPCSSLVVSPIRQLEVIFEYATRNNIHIHEIVFESELGQFGLFGTQVELVRTLNLIKNTNLCILSHSPCVMTQDTNVLRHCYSIITHERLLFCQQNLVRKSSAIKRMLRNSLVVLSQKSLGLPENTCSSCSRFVTTGIAFTSKTGTSFCGHCVVDFMKKVMDGEMEVRVEEQSEWKVIEDVDLAFSNKLDEKDVVNNFSMYGLEEEEMLIVKDVEPLFQKPVHSVQHKKRNYRKTGLK
jgi:hypothetical protein